MFRRAIDRMRELVRAGRYVMTLHGTEEMEADDLTAFDVEHCILTGTIIGRQRDRTFGGWKYLVRGRTVSGDRAVVVGRIGPVEILIIITVYRL